MRVRVEPKDFLMHSVFVAFSQDHPDPEDADVKAYLAERDLIAKRLMRQNWDDQDFEVMYFGGCYLGGHLRVIGDMQRKAVEQEMIAAEIARTLSETTDPATRRAADDTPELQLKELIASMAQEFHQDSSFGKDEEGYLKVTLEPVLIQQKFVEMAAK